MPAEPTAPVPGVPGQEGQQNSRSALNPQGRWADRHAVAGGRAGWRGYLLLTLAFVTGLLLPAAASGPRYVSGPPFFTGSAGRPVMWRQSTLLYSTDPGDLSASVDHRAADLLVLSAASVWNVPVASINLAQGGTLAEHVSSSNTYLSGAGMVYPADVDRTNAAAIPIAVVYDSDGSVTESLLGAGASDPLSCRQNAVTESVDAFDPAGYILHAVLIVNGRCSGPAAEQQMELRYRLERAFGRVLGLAWSQTNDNVFTGNPVPTYQQYLHWPILHPIDILCGPYSYQCVPSPFTLRDDDVAGLVALYPIDPGAVLTGKQPSLAQADAVGGTVQFPTGAGMAGVNVQVQRRYLNSLQIEPWNEASSVSGFAFRRAGTSPFVLAGSDALASEGTVDGGFAGYFHIAYVPLLPGYAQDTLVTSIEPVNPLYTGQYSLGPYAAGTVSPSGSLDAPVSVFAASAYTSAFVSLAPQSNATSCGPGGDGTLSLPAGVAASGWWSGLLCGYGHAAYTGLSVRPGRTLTVEATALDDLDLATYQKAMPVIGVFSVNDGAGSLPSVAVAPVAFTGRGIGTTALVAATGDQTGLTIGIADQRGDGRPDFRYQARILYADTVSPAQVPDVGGVVTISGLGFRAGNTVSVNGVAATVISTSANSMVARLPARSAVGASLAQAVDVKVADLGTGASSIMSAVVRYGAPLGSARLMKLLTVQAGTAYVGMQTPVAFAVQMLAADGATPVAGEPVTLSLSAGAARFEACGLATCTLLTDANGVATTGVTPLAAGKVTPVAADGLLTEGGSFLAVDPAGAIKLLLGPAPVGPVNDAFQPLIVQVLDANGNAMANRLVEYTTTVGSAFFDRCAATRCALMTDNSGVSVVQFQPTQVGTVTVRAASGGIAVSVTMTATDNSDSMVLVRVPDAQQTLGQAEALTVRLLKHDGATPDAGRTVVFTGSDGISFPSCGASTCSALTGGDGIADMALRAAKIGTASVTASFGNVSQTVSFAVRQATASIHIVSAPSGTIPVNQAAATPFSIQVIGPDGATPVAGMRIALAGTPDAVLLDICSADTCALNTDGNGTVTTRVKPLRAGMIALNAIAGALVASTSFTATGASRSLHVVSAPGAGGVQVGEQAAFTLQVLDSDGVTPLAGGFVEFATTYGSFLVGACGYSHCSVPSDQNGMVTMTGVGLAPGLASVTATTTFADLSQTMTFPVFAKGPAMRLVSAPTANALVGRAADQPMTVQMLDRDGITPLPGQTVTFTVTQGQARLGACAATVCRVVTDANGLASAAVTPTGPGAIALLATDGPANQTAVLTGVLPPDVLTVVSVPGSDSAVGSTASTPFRVQALAADRVTPAQGRTVTMSVSAGHASLAACAGASSCTLPTDGNGLVTTDVTPQTTGAITLTVQDGGVAVSASFVARPAPDQLEVLAAPPAHVRSGQSGALSVAVFAGDGVTPRVGRAVTIAVTSGRARLGACGVASCTLSTLADGSVATTIMPLAAGAISIGITSGTLQRAVSFTADPLPDTLTVTSQPADGAYVGEAATAVFAVKAMAGDGSPAAGRSLTFSAGNASLALCGRSSCAMVTDAFGMAASVVTPLAPGPVTLSALEDGASSVLAGFIAVSRPDSLGILSQPADGSIAGQVTTAPLRLRVVRAGGTQAVALTVTVANGSAVLAACGQATCSLTTDAGGYASTQVIPGAAGEVTLRIVEANDARVAASVSFRVDAAPDVLRLLTPVPGSMQVGDMGSFTVQAVLADQATPAPGRRLSAHLDGGGTLACGSATCTLTTDRNGLATTSLSARSAGTLSLTIVEAAAPGSNQLAATVTVLDRPDVLMLLASPATVAVEQTAATPLSLRLTLADGSTPVAGVALHLTAAGDGALSLDGCGQLPCTVLTNVDGTVGLVVRGLASGSVQIAAQADTVPLSQPVTTRVMVVAGGTSSDTMTALTATTYVAAGVQYTRTFEVLAARGSTPVAGLEIMWSATGAASALTPQTATGADGIARGAGSFGPLVAGGQSSVTACAWAGVCATFASLGVAEDDWRARVIGGDGQAVVGAVFAPVTLQVTDLAGHPVAGAPVSIYQTVTAGDLACPDRGRCPVAPVLATQATVAATDAGGLVSVLPLSVDGQAATTRILFATGSLSSATVVLTREP